MSQSERSLHPVSADSAGARVRSGDLLAALAATDAEGLPAAWLAVQCRSVDDCRRGVVLLGVREGGPFQVAATWPEADAKVAPALSEAAQSALTRREGLVVANAGGTDGAVVAEPVELGGALRGAVVLEIPGRPAAEIEELRLALRIGFGWLAAWVERQRADAQKTRKGQLEVVLGLVAAALEHDRFQGAAMTFATELASELGCERVAVGFLERSRVRLRGLSHSSKFGERTNLIRSIEAAMEEAIDQQASVVHPVSGAERTRAAHAHAELLRQFGAEAVCTVPLVHAGKPVGALTLERDVPFDESTVLLLEVVAALAGPVLEGMRRDDRFIGSKLLESLREGLGNLVGPRHIALKLITAGLALVLVFLAVARGEYRVTADTMLEPAVKRAASAPFDGYVAVSAARAGDIVSEGDLLARLEDRDLVLERVKWESELDKTEKQYRQTRAERDAAGSRILSAQIAEASAELDRIVDRLERIELRAPFDGVVVAGDLTQKLGSPVRRGDVLFEIAPLDAYRVLLQVDERDIAELELGQSGNLVLSSLPEDSYRFRVTKITPVAVAEEGMNSFRVEAQLEETSERLRPGIEGVAKVEVGERRLLWIWTHAGIDWLRLRLWSWMP